LIFYGFLLKMSSKAEREKITQIYNDTSDSYYYWTRIDKLREPVDGVQSFYQAYSPLCFGILTGTILHTFSNAALNHAPWKSSHYLIMGCTFWGFLFHYVDKNLITIKQLTEQKHKQLLDEKQDRIEKRKKMMENYQPYEEYMKKFKKIQMKQLM